MRWKVSFMGVFQFLNPGIFCKVLSRILMVLGVILLGCIMATIVINMTGAGKKPFWSEKYPIDGIKLEASGVPSPELMVPGSNPPKPYYKNLRIIEFDEYGDFWDSRQLREAANLIGEVDGNPHGTPLIIFVHGWRHDADSKPRSYGNDLIRFNNFLEKYEADRKQSGGPQSKHGSPVGVFIGWRGRSIKVRGLEYLSFPPRRIATNRISASTAFSRCLWDLRRYANRNRYETRVVLIGHSLGGRILERVASPPIINYANSMFREAAHKHERDIWNHAIEEVKSSSPEFDLSSIPHLQVCDDYINDRKSGVLEPVDLDDLQNHLEDEGILNEGLVHGIDLCRNGLDYRNRFLLGDLVLLINPASEAIQARQLKLATNSWHWDEAPAMISLTSETDAVTGGILPKGKWFEKLIFPTVPLTENRFTLGKLGHEFQSGYVEHTCGHDRRIVSGVVNQDGKVRSYPKVFETLFDKYLYDGVRYAPMDRIEDAERRITIDKGLLEEMEVKVDISRAVSDKEYRYDHEKRTIYVDKSLVSKFEEAYPDPVKRAIKAMVSSLDPDEKTASNRYLSHKLPVGGYLVLRVEREILSGHGGKPDDGGIFNSRMQKLCFELINETKRVNYRDSHLEKFIWDVDYDYKQSQEAGRREFQKEEE